MCRWGSEGRWGVLSSSGLVWTCREARSLLSHHRLVERGGLSLLQLCTTKVHEEEGIALGCWMMHPCRHTSLHKSVWEMPHQVLWSHRVAASGWGTIPVSPAPTKRNPVHDTAFCTTAAGIKEGFSCAGNSMNKNVRNWLSHQ